MDILPALRPSCARSAQAPSASRVTGSMEQPCYPAVIPGYSSVPSEGCSKPVPSAQVPFYHRNTEKHCKNTCSILYLQQAWSRRAKNPLQSISVVMLSTALRLLVKLWTGNGLTQHTGGAADFYLKWVCKEHCHSVTCDKELKHCKEEKEQHWNCDELPSSSSVRAPVLRKVCTKLSQSTKKGYNSSLLCNSKQICYFSTWKFSEASKQDTPN